MSTTSAPQYSRAGSKAAPAKKPFDPRGAQFEPHAMALQQVSGFYKTLIGANTATPDLEEGVNQAKSLTA